MRPMSARLERGVGFGPGPRVRPVPDRFVGDWSDVLAARAEGALPLLDPGLGGDGGPNVLITTDLVGDLVRIEASYARSVARVGGRPWLVPPGERDLDGLLARADAIVLAGGAFDIHPRHYGQAVTARLDRVVLMIVPCSNTLGFYTTYFIRPWSSQNYLIFTRTSNMTYAV